MILPLAPIPKIRILLADDHAVVRTGIKALIDAESDMEVVGEAEDGRQAVALAKTLIVDIAVVDVNMPEQNGAEVTQQVKSARPEIKVLALTVHEGTEFVKALLGAGATGYLVKRAAAKEIVQAIRAVVAGGVYLDPRIAGQLVSASGAVDENSAVKLSLREDEVLRWVAKGHTNKEIAAQLSMSIKTVETYRGRGMKKLGLKSRADVVRHAAHAGWLGV